MPDCKILTALNERQDYRRAMEHVAWCSHEQCEGLREIFRYNTGQKDVMSFNVKVDIAIEVAQKYIDILEKFECTDIHERNAKRSLLVNSLRRVEKDPSFENVARLLMNSNSARWFLTETMHSQLTSGGTI